MLYCGPLFFPPHNPGPSALTLPPCMSEAWRVYDRILVRAILKLSPHACGCSVGNPTTWPPSRRKAYKQATITFVGCAGRSQGQCGTSLLRLAGRGNGIVSNFRRATPKSVSYFGVLIGVEVLNISRQRRNSMPLVRVFEILVLQRERRGPTSLAFDKGGKGAGSAPFSREPWVRRLGGYGANC